MKLLLLSAVALLAATSPALAWGGLFNRFSPEMLSNLGYGGHGYGSYRAQPLLQEGRETVGLHCGRIPPRRRSHLPASLPPTTPSSQEEYRVTHALPGGTGKKLLVPYRPAPRLLSSPPGASCEITCDTSVAGPNSLPDWLMGELHLPTKNTTDGESFITTLPLPNENRPAR